MLTSAGSKVLERLISDRMNVDLYPLTPEMVSLASLSVLSPATGAAAKGLMFVDEGKAGHETIPQ